MDRSRDYARGLLRKAHEDAWMMSKLMESGEAPDWGLGFHAQQAAEKAIKAVVASRNREFPYTHDLKTLLGVLAVCKVPPPPDDALLPVLTI